MTSYGLSILINDKLGKIPLDETEINLFIVLKQDHLKQLDFGITFPKCLPAYSLDNSIVDACYHC